MSAVSITDPIVLEVFGVPQPQGNKTGFFNKKTGRVAMVEGRRPDARAAFKDWREAVSQAARDWQAAHGQPLLDEPLGLHVVFRMPRPKSLPKSRVWPDRRPDSSKLLRAVEDSLTGIVIADDSRFCDIHVVKRYAIDAPPGCTITIEKLT